MADVRAHELSPAADPEVMLRAAGISKRFGGVEALRDVGIEVRSGEVAALVGDNGAGKSTLVGILSGAIRPDHGRIWCNGQEVRFHSPIDARNAGVETVYQTLALANHLDVAANLFLGRERYLLQLGPFSILNRAAMRREARDLVARTGVRIPDIDSAVMNMSGGQRQGVAIARAAGWGSRVVLLDEPTAALGVQETARVLEIIKTLKRQGITIVMVSHNLRQVFGLADSIWVLRHGQMAGRREVRATRPEEIVSMITGVGQAVGDEFA